MGEERASCRVSHDKDAQPIHCARTSKLRCRVVSGVVEVHCCHLLLTNQPIEKTVSVIGWQIQFFMFYTPER